MLSHLICVGLSHKTTPVEIRERAALDSQRQAQLLARVAARQLSGVSEIAVLSTCNRTELYAVGVPDVAAQALNQVLIEQADESDIPAGTRIALQYDWESAVYCLTDDQCVDHVLRVAAGLDSQVIGEPQILGQITDAYEQASAYNATGAVLSTLMQQAIHAGKRVRHETELGDGALSISSIAALYARDVIGSLQQACVLVIGAGEMARAAAAAFIRRDVDRLMIANRTLEHAQEIADEWDGRAIPFTRLGEALAEADVVIAAAFAPHTLLHREDIAGVLARRSGRPLIIFDIAVPRNVAPEVAELPGVKLYNLDDLEAVSAEHRVRRESAVPHAEAIVHEEAEIFAQWWASRSVVPTIQQLRAKAESIRQSELDHALRRLPDLTEHERQILDEFSHRLVNKLLHQPTLTLKDHSVDSEMYARVLADLFDLDAEPGNASLRQNWKAPW